MYRVNHLIFIALHARLILYKQDTLSFILFHVAKRVIFMSWLFLCVLSWHLYCAIRCSAYSIQTYKAIATLFFIRQQVSLTYHSVVATPNLSRDIVSLNLAGVLCPVMSCGWFQILGAAEDFLP